MPTERMEEVEVVCRTCQGKWPQVCSGGCRGTGAETMGVFPGSLTAARLRLADAAEAWAAKWLAPVACRDADEWDAMLDAAIRLAALRTKRAGG